MIQMTGLNGLNRLHKHQRQPMAAVQFKGIHPDAIVGGDIKLIDTQRYAGNQKRLFQSVKNILNFNKVSQAVPLMVEMEQTKGHPAQLVVKAPIGQNGVGIKLGYVPNTLAQGLAPHVKQGTPVAAWLMGIRPHASGQTYDMKIRLECLNESGKAPDLTSRDSMLQAFKSARAVNTPEEKGFQQVLTMIPERIKTFTEGNTEVIERFNQEQGQWGESTFFVNGSEVFRALIDPAKNMKLPQALTDTLNDAAAHWMTQQLNLERAFPGDTFNQFA